MMKDLKVFIERIKASSRYGKRNHSSWIHWGQSTQKEWLKKSD
jgi:hypothetical protein